MKKLLSTILLLTLISCGDGDLLDEVAGTCTNSKQPASYWTREDGAAFDLTGTVPATTYELVVINDGSCIDGDGEALFEYYTDSKTYYESECDGSNIVVYDYNISCDNVLTLTKRTTGEKVTFR